MAVAAAAAATGTQLVKARDMLKPPKQTTGAHHANHARARVQAAGITIKLPHSNVRSVLVSGQERHAGPTAAHTAERNSGTVP